MYQNGDVDFLVATDAIGMGLNLDIGHVALSDTHKFDGRRMRPLFPYEIGQIAGRAGRYLTPGTFGVTGEAGALDDEVIEAVESHRFAPVERLQWRNGALDYGSADRLIASLEVSPRDERLTRGRDADDLIALKALAERADIRDRLRDARDVKLLWSVCRVPDFRSISSQEHISLLDRIFGFLHDKGHVPDDWLSAQIGMIDRTDGEIDTLSKRLAFIRTWTYVAQRQGWTNDESHWRDATRAVEDRLSDALHARLTQRFVDRRTSVLLRRLKQKESLVAEVSDKGEVTIEGEFAGRLEGFRFRQDASQTPDEAKTLARAGYEALRPEFHLRADKFYNAPDTELDFTEQGGLMWGASAVGKLVKGTEALKPQVEPFVDEEAGEEVAEKVRRRLQHFIDRKIATQFEPLLALGRDETLTGMARGFAFRLTEALGVLPREAVANDVKALDQETRGMLRKHGVRFGQFTIFQPLLLKPAPTRLRLVLWSLAQGLQTFPESPPPGLVTIPNIADVPGEHYTLSGYRPAGARAIRIDMLERLADQLRQKDTKAGFEATADMLSITGMTLEQFADLMAGLGYKADKGERVKARPEPAPLPVRREPVDEDAVVNPIPEGRIGAGPGGGRGGSPRQMPSLRQRRRDGGVLHLRLGPEAARPARRGPQAGPRRSGAAPRRRQARQPHPPEARRRGRQRAARRQAPGGDTRRQTVRQGQGRQALGQAGRQGRRRPEAHVRGAPAAQRPDRPRQSLCRGPDGAARQDLTGGICPTQTASGWTSGCGRRGFSGRADLPQM